MDKENLLFNAKAIHAGNELKPMVEAHVRPIYLTSPFVMEKAKKANNAESGDTKCKININTRYADPVANVIRNILMKMIQLSE